MVPDQKEQMNNNSVQHMFLDRILDQQGKGVIIETVDKILMGSVDWTVGSISHIPTRMVFIVEMRRQSLFGQDKH